VILVDTSVMIGFLQGDDNDAVRRFQYVLDNKITFGITSLIYQEGLQGVKTEKDFEKVKRYLDTQRFYDLKDIRESYAAAAKIYFLCRKKGMTLGSTIDCLIAQTAIENNLFLLHNDADFDRIAKVVDLKIFSL
jgi:predicted nucleic acid-binding protein